MSEHISRKPEGLGGYGMADPGQGMPTDMPALAGIEWDIL